MFFLAYQKRAVSLHRFLKSGLHMQGSKSGSMKRSEIVKRLFFENLNIS